MLLRQYDLGRDFSPSTCISTSRNHASGRQSPVHVRLLKSCFHHNAVLVGTLGPWSGFRGAVHVGTYITGFGLLGLQGAPSLGLSWGLCCTGSSKSWSRGPAVAEPECADECAVLGPAESGVLRECGDD